MVALDPVVIFTAPAVEQVDTAVPATAVGAAVIVIVLVDVALVHPAFAMAVNVNVLLPAVISAELGVYVAVISEVAFVKVPVPLDVHVIPAWLLALEPVVIFTAPVLEQVGISIPAIAVGGCDIVNVLVDVAAVQVPLGFAVNVSITLPAVISAVLGV